MAKKSFENQRVKLIRNKAWKGAEMSRCQDRPPASCQVQSTDSRQENRDAHGFLSEGTSPCNAVSHWLPRRRPHRLQRA